MTEIRNFDYHFANKTYQIKVFQDANGYVVRSFLGHAAANGYSYRVDFELNARIEFDEDTPGFSRLIASAIADIKSDIWEKVQKARNKR